MERRKQTINQDSFGNINNKYVIVLGYAGLGNRLRTIGSAIDYCAKSGRTIAIDWCDGMFADEGVNSFDKFFEIYNFPFVAYNDIAPDSFYPNSFCLEMLNRNINNYFKRKECSNFFVRKSINLALLTMGKFQLDNLRFQVARYCKYFVKKENGDININDMDNKIVFGGDLKKKIDADAVVYIDNVPEYKENILWEHVRLKPEIRKIVDDFVSEQGLRKNSLGIHIRATDKHFLGSLDSLVKKIDKLIKEKGISKIFLCTDSMKVENLMFNHFKEKLITYPKYLPDTGRQGVHKWAVKQENNEHKERIAREAVIDMFCLAETEYMLYQFGSTFSEISKIYYFNRGGVKCKSWREFQFLGF